MAALRELTGAWIEVQNMLEDPDADLQAIADTLEGIEGEIEAKADCYESIIKSMEGDIATIKAEEERLHARRKSLENRAKWLKDNLEMAMRITNKWKFKTALYSFSIQKNPPSVVLDEQYIENIPEEYLIYQEPTINKKQMLVDMRSGKDLEGIAHLVQTESLRIR